VFRISVVTFWLCDNCLCLFLGLGPGCSVLRPGVTSLGFLPTHGGGHSAAAWYLRTRPAIQEAFARVWEVKQEELLSSFDTFIVWRPWWDDGNGTYQTSWTPCVENLHVDQNPHYKKGLQCVQGMVPLLPVRKEIGGLQVVPNTNTAEQQAEFVKRYPMTKLDRDDWLELNNNDPIIGTGQFIEADPGDLILWDSRTVHGGFVGPGPVSNSPAMAESTASESKQANTELARMSFTVCMTPASKASQQVIQQRCEAFQKGRCLTHWPHEFHPHYMNDTFGSRIQPQSFTHKFPITDTIKRLVRGPAKPSVSAAEQLFFNRLMSAGAE